MDMMSYLPAISTAISFVITVILAKIFIPVLKSVKMGQKILDIGPRWHKSKEGTPTMGGLFFIAAFIVVVAILGFFTSMEDGAEIFIHAIFMIFCGLIGFLDDYVKFFKKQNKGLSARQKLVFQFLTAGAYLLSLSLAGKLDTFVRIPFTDMFVDFGIIFYIFALVGIVFTVNSVNLTDGIDGLASSVTLVISVFFVILCRRAGTLSAELVASSIVGGTAGFLVYNFHPAKVFMGDTGSLFLGGYVSAMAFWLDIPLLLVFVGIIYYVESFSVMIQVLSYKLTKKRVFKMTPIHHHFEMCNWDEIKIVTVFSITTAIFCTIGVFAFI